MNKEMILSIADQHFRKASPDKTRWIFNKIFYGPFIPKKKLSAARQAYASFCLEDDIPILLYDDTLFGSGKTGFLITNNKFYYSMSASYGSSNIKGSLKLSTIQSFSVQLNNISSNIFVNDKKLGNVTQISRAEALIIENFFDLIRFRSLHSAHDLVAAASDSSTPVIDSKAAIMTKIQLLQELLDKDIITQEEFESKKRNLLFKI